MNIKHECRNFVNPIDGTIGYFIKPFEKEIRNDFAEKVKYVMVMSLWVIL